MTEPMKVDTDVASFVEQWQAGEMAMKTCFETLYRAVSTFGQTSLSCVARPGVSFSLRPRHENQQQRELFAMIDVIDDNPEERWLSVCFYGDMITDPEERGELIPGGLAGDDGYCFDVYAVEADTTAYLLARLEEAWRNAGKE